MKTIKFLAVYLLVAVAVFTSCTDNENPSQGANVKFYLTDAPSLAAFKEINIDIQKIEYSVNDTDWVDLPMTAGIYNLLELTNGKDTLLSDIVLNEGEHVEQVRLVLGANNTIVFQDGTSTTIKTPSAETSGLKLNIQENITSSSSYAVRLDFDANKSIVAKGNGSYSLKPIIRGYVIENTSTVSGNIIPADVPFKVFTIADNDTITAISDTTQNNFFMLHGLKTGTYDIQFQSLTTGLTVKTSSVSIFGGTDKDLGTVSLAN